MPDECQVFFHHLLVVHDRANLQQIKSSCRGRALLCPHRIDINRKFNFYRTSHLILPDMQNLVKRIGKRKHIMLKDIDERQYLAATGIVTVTDDLVIRIVGRDNKLQRTVRIGIFQVQAKQVKRIINRELFGQVLQIERIITGLRLT